MARSWALRSASRLHPWSAEVVSNATIVNIDRVTTPFGIKAMLQQPDVDPYAAVANEQIARLEPTRTPALPAGVRAQRSG
jgi:hypothetical protein